MAPGNQLRAHTGVPMNDKIRIVVVDDHPLLREGVVKTLGMQPDFEVVGQGATADDASDLACDLLPDILLLDITIRESGLHAIREIADSCPAIKLVILTASEQEGDVVAALRAGARAYILNDVAPTELVAVLRAVYAGEVYITPSLAASLLHEMAASRGKAAQLAGPLDKLTDREREILEGVAAGLSNKEIGKRLFLSEKTIKHYMTNILQKLQVRNRVEAALFAQRHLPNQQAEGKAAQHGGTETRRGSGNQAPATKDR